MLAGFQSRLCDVMAVHAHPFSLHATFLYSSRLMPRMLMVGGVKGFIHRIAAIRHCQIWLLVACPLGGEGSSRYLTRLPTTSPSPLAKLHAGSDNFPKKWTLDEIRLEHTL